MLCSTQFPKCSVNGFKAVYESHVYITVLYVYKCGRGSSVGIATGYGLDGPGIESRWGRDFPHLSRPALGPTQPPIQWLPGLSWGYKSGRSVTLTSHPLLVPWPWKSRAISLLPLWAVRPVQSLSACTRVRLTLTFMCIQIFNPTNINTLWHGPSSSVWRNISRFLFWRC